MAKASNDSGASSRDNRVENLPQFLGLVRSGKRVLFWSAGMFLAGHPLPDHLAAKACSEQSNELAQAGQRSTEFRPKHLLNGPEACMLAPWLMALCGWFAMA